MIQNLQPSRLPSNIAMKNKKTGPISMVQNLPQRPTTNIAMKNKEEKWSHFHGPKFTTSKTSH